MKENYVKWVKEFMDSWKDLDWNKTLSLMAKNVEYYENPIDRPCSDFEEVKKLWEIVEENQKDIEYKFDIIAYTDDVCVVNWQMKREFIPTGEVQNIDGMFMISLDENNLLKSFKQWRYTKIEEK